MSHNPHTPTHQTHFHTVYNTYNTLPPHAYTHGLTHTLTFHFEDISHNEQLICGLILGRARFRALLMEGLIVCQLPGCQITHVGSLPGFFFLSFHVCSVLFLSLKSTKLDWYASSLDESCMPYLSDRPLVLQTAGTSGQRIGVWKVQRVLHYCRLCMLWFAFVMEAFCVSGMGNCNS